MEIGVALRSNTLGRRGESLNLPPLLHTVLLTRTTIGAQLLRTRTVPLISLVVHPPMGLWQTPLGAQAPIRLRIDQVQGASAHMRVRVAFLLIWERRVLGRVSI